MKYLSISSTGKSILTKNLCFDMDGTLADFYDVPNWLEKLHNEDASPYRDALPMWNMKELRETLLCLMRQKWKIYIISWLAKNSTTAYGKAVSDAKKEWLSRYDFPCDEIYLLPYGTSKVDYMRSLSTNFSVLVDDNAEVRDEWDLGVTINPITSDLLFELKKFLKNS